MYRPDKDWYKKRGGITGCTDIGCRCSECVAFEAGADAMLEGILKYGHYNVDWSDNCWDIPEAHRGKKGILVFIPEEVCIR